MSLFCSLERLVPANWTDYWCNFLRSILDTLFIANDFFRTSLKGLETGPARGSQMRTASLSLQQTGLSATWHVTSKTSAPCRLSAGTWAAM